MRDNQINQKYKAFRFFCRLKYNSCYAKLFFVTLFQSVVPNAIESYVASTSLHFCFLIKKIEQPPKIIIHSAQEAKELLTLLFSFLFFFLKKRFLMLRNFLKFLPKHAKAFNGTVRKCMCLVRGAIQTHCATFNIDLTFGGVVDC